MIPKLILEEIENSADILSEEDDESCQTDAGYLYSCKTKLENNESLTENEREVLEDELENWTTKDFFTVGKGKKALIQAMASLGFLEVYDPEAYYSSKPKTNVVEGVRYITW